MFSSKISLFDKKYFRTNDVSVSLLEEMRLISLILLFIVSFHGVDSRYSCKGLRGQNVDWLVIQALK